MSAEQSNNPVNLAPPAVSLSDMAAVENFLRLRQSQEEFLAWLESCEKKPHVDQYIYRKIR
jgi:hypothetical protein